MKHVFYILVFLQIIYETAKIFGCRKLYRETEAMNGMDETARKWYLWANPYLGIALILDVIGMATLVMGMFTSQWYLFLLVLVQLLPAPEVRRMGCLSGQHHHHRDFHLRIYGRIQSIAYGKER